MRAVLPVRLTANLCQSAEAAMFFPTDLHFFHWHRLLNRRYFLAIKMAAGKAGR